LTTTTWTHEEIERFKAYLQEEAGGELPKEFAERLLSFVVELDNKTVEMINLLVAVYSFMTALPDDPVSRAAKKSGILQKIEDMVDGQTHQMLVEFAQGEKDAH